MNQTRNQGLDLLRALACYMVIQVHAGEFFYIGAEGKVLSGPDAMWTNLYNSLFRTADSLPVRFISEASGLSYGIYLMHIMVLNAFYALLSPLGGTAAIQIPCIAVCTFIVSFILTKLLSLLPKSNYFIG